MTNCRRSYREPALKLRSSFRATTPVSLLRIVIQKVCARFLPRSLASWLFGSRPGRLAVISLLFSNLCNTTRVEYVFLFRAITLIKPSRPSINLYRSMGMHVKNQKTLGRSINRLDMYDCRFRLWLASRV